eukprot:CAMPEP_0176222522 /NCGR_PEP_ID=MMETSP0121_2-20121125/20277_1 /TAXON_ID=160619 /ORGANISM="Kryptoperidinium foliaceum, Strain CCMP 1326" /LENGTH=232 /DNA_ID=CAMNT_0017561737 /DNA_START=69 /DNA_END=767 /DNA_ORIENTATION=+
MAPCRSMCLLAASIVQGAMSITSEMQDVLDQHNLYRCMHDVPLFTWDDAIAASAQQWADNGAFEHSPSSSRKVGGEQLGENLAWGYPTRTGTASTIAWYDEIKFTDPYGTADSFTDTTQPGEAIGHYTQVVWSTSVKLGCGKGKATVGGNAGDLWVCQYGPAGNYGGQFAEKVKAPTKTEAACKAAGGGDATTAPPKGGTTAAPVPSTSSAVPSSPPLHILLALGAASVLLR